MRRSFILSLTAAAVLATSGAAQAGPCADKGPKLPAAGNWVTYHSDSGDIKMLYLGHETGGERLEMTMNRMERGKPMNGVVQMVVPGYPYEMTQVTEMVMQMGDQPAMKMSGCSVYKDSISTANEPNDRGRRLDCVILLSV